MIDRPQAGAILSEMVKIVRDFGIAGHRSRQRSLTGTKFGALQHLRADDARLGELADHLLVSPSVASRAVDSLAAGGMVRRRSDARDARAVLISITDRGRESLAERETYFVDLFADALADWSPDEARQAINILQKLGAHLGEVIESLEAEATAGMASTGDQTTTTHHESEINA